MNTQSIIRVVLDTNVVFEGLTKQGGIAGAIIQAWYNGLITVCITDAMVYEYEDVLTRKLSPKRIDEVETALMTLLDLAEPVTVYYRWRPSSPDPSDEFVIDCTMNANAVLVTSNIKDFRLAQQTLGLQLMTPKEFLALLVE